MCTSSALVLEFSGSLSTTTQLPDMMAGTAVTTPPPLSPSSSPGIERDERNNGSRWDKASINGSSGRGLTLSTSLSTPPAAATALTATGDAGSSSTSFSSASPSSSSSTAASAKSKPSRCRHHHHRRGASRRRYNNKEEEERRQEEEEEEEENNLLLQQQTGYVTTYPKLQLVKIDDNWYALNQTCLQIYQQLQMCGTAQLMPVDVVPLNKLPECVRKSLSSPDRESSQNKPSPSSSNGMKQQTGRSRPMNANNGDVVGGGALRIYDVMSDSAATSAAATSANAGSGTANGASTLFMPRPRGHQPQTTLSGTNGDDKSSPSWWWRFLPVVSCRRQSTSSRVQQQQQQIVQQLVEETLRQPILTPPLSSLTKNGSSGGGLQQPLDSTDSDGAAYVYVCVICSSTYPTHRLLQRHRDRASHYGCSICSKSFKSFSTLQDHCELLSHYSDDSEDDESEDDDELSEDECLFSSETCSSGGDDNFHEADD